MPPLLRASSQFPYITHGVSKIGYAPQRVHHYVRAHCVIDSRKPKYKNAFDFKERSDEVFRAYGPQHA